VDRIRSVLEPRHIFEWFKNKGISEYEDLLRRIEMIYVSQNQAKRGFFVNIFLLIYFSSNLFTTDY